MQKYDYFGKEFDCISIEPSIEDGFNFPFTILIPENLRKDPELIYAYILPLGGRYSLDSNNKPSFEDILSKAKEDKYSIDKIMMHLFETGNPMIIPTIPKVGHFRPNFLGSLMYKNDFSKYEDFWFRDYLEKYRNLQDQIKSIIEYSIKTLRDIDINVPYKVIMTGYSEGSKGISHYALLHPETIKYIVVGGTSGLMSVPLKELDGYTLNYPIGINDIPDFDYDSYKQIRFFYYSGEEDLSDPGIPKFEKYYYTNDKGEKVPLTDECGNYTPHLDENGNANFILDENGNYKGMFDLFTDEEVNILNKLYGTKCIERIKKQETIFSKLGLDVETHIYLGNHITVFENIKQITSDIDSFLGFDKK